ncbi:autotransporter domain-containing protein [Stenotrophomonas sp.]|uniref:autotransporter domain-containing protein n=1 Tax=Stenotrophomonas sp. TaxID=69392 RepID=UPI0028B24A99|nr:autotransporter domain-containing protein [Stenotrophomonas sp.]
MTVNSLSRATFRRPSPSLLASAIIGTLLAASAVPALATPTRDALQRYQQQRAEQSAAFGRDLQSVPLAAAFAAPTASIGQAGYLTSPRVSAEAANPILGKPGDVESWHSDEFNADWGLAAMGADYAYARGLTGQGVRLGVFDSGSALAHDEFAGRNTSSISIGNGGCADPSIVAGEGACGSTRGDRPGYNYYGLGPGVPPALADRLIAAGQPYGFSYADHGTHVLGTVGANRDGNGMHGVAFGANLTAARVFGDTYYEWRLDPDNFYRPRALYRTDPDDAATLDMYAQADAQGVRALNHSWGISTRHATVESLDAQYAAIGADYGVYGSIYGETEGAPGSKLIQVWSAGNSAGGMAGITAALPRWNPEIEPYWLAVANVRLPTAGETDYVIDASSSICGASANWCLSAPGTNIASTIVAGEINGRMELTEDYLRFLIESESPEYTYGYKTGTSMAAPHITGALGLLMERFPYLDNAQVRDVLLTTARDLGAPGVDAIYGWGMVDLKTAIEGYGLLRVDTDVVMNQKAGGLKVWEGDAWDDWTNDIGGPGKLTKSGIGWLRLSGDNSFNGAIVRDGVLELDGANALTASVDVQGGQFLLNGSLVSTTLNSLGGTSLITSTGVLDGSALNVTGGVVSFNGVQQGGSTVVGAKGTLKGVGTLGSTRVEGIIAPGNSIGTLTINGDYVQTATGIYQAELAPGSRSDLLRVTGTATLDGTLKALPEAGVYYLGEQFNFLQAAGGINGQFATTDFSAFSPFLKFSLGYSANGLRIDVARGNALASAAVTPNQIAVATSADGLAINQGLPKPLTQLFPAQVGAALDALSGELHAATPMALVESSRYLRDAALSRAVGVRSPGAADEAAGGGAWVQAIGGSGKLDGDANAARTDSNSNGLLVGADHVFGGGWQVGGLVGTGRTDIKQAAGRGARSEIDNTHFGAYVGNQWGAFGLRAGLGYSRHDVDSKRQLTFAGYQDALSATYDATTRQGFIEGAYRFGGREGGLEPYLQFARVEVDVDGITEQGGAAALHGQVADTRTNVATAGVRFDKGLKTSWQQESWLHVRGGVGYRRASGDRSQVADLAWTGGSSFAVSGAAIADNAVVAELGLSAWLSPRNQLELGYNGTFGDDARDRSVTARWSVQF